VVQVVAGMAAMEALEVLEQHQITACQIQVVEAVVLVQKILELSLVRLAALAS
jgi:hypothetical protein